MDIELDDVWVALFALLLFVAFIAVVVWAVGVVAEYITGKKPDIWQQIAMAILFLMFISTLEGRGERRG